MAYSWSCVTKDWAAGDTVIGVENNDATLSLYIQEVVVSTATATRALIFASDGVTVAGTNAVTGVNLNRNYGNNANATCYDDETGNGEAALSWPRRFSETILLAGQTQSVVLDGAIVLPPDGFIGVDLVADTTGGTATIIGWFE